VTASARAEILKLRKRPATWILTGLLLATFALFGYLFGYLFLVREIGGEAAGVAADDDYLGNLLPDQFVASTLSGLAGFGGVFALILGALAVGSEYGWGTWKTITTQRPSRLALAAGKLAGVALVVLALTVACLLVALLASLAIAGLEGEAVVLPSVATMLGGVGASWLVLMVWTAIGVLLAVVFRGTGLAIGLGVAYVLLIEQLVISLPLPDAVADVFAATMIGPNAVALADAFGELVLTGVALDPVGPAQAALVLSAYLAGALLLAGWLVSRREVA
jgi:ABC-2 type transport system permease protein